VNYNSKKFKNEYGKYLQKCTSEVKSNHGGIACDLYSKWYHAECVGITAEPYKQWKQHLNYKRSKGLNISNYT